MNYRKEICYDREVREYALYLDGELVGFARTYHEGEVTLDQLVFELLSGDAAHSATELDSGSDPDAMAAESTAGLIDPLPDPGPGGPGVPGDERPYMFTHQQLNDLLFATIDMYLEFRDVHEHSAEDSRFDAVDEMFQGLDADRELAQFDPTERLRLQLA